MKKLFYLLLVIPFAMMISSCTSDKDLPNVNVSMTFENAASDGTAIYVVADETFSITGLTTKAVDSNKQSAIVNVKYFWNGVPAPDLTWSGFPMEINLPEAGRNVLSLQATLLEVDKSMAYTTINVPIVAVGSEEDLPAGLTLGDASFTLTTAQSDK